MQDGLGGDTCQCAVGNGDRLTNGRTDGCSGSDTNSPGNESVSHDYQYRGRPELSTASVFRASRTWNNILSNYEVINTYWTIKICIDILYNKTRIMIYRGFYTRHSLYMWFGNSVKHRIESKSLVRVSVILGSSYHADVHSSVHLKNVGFNQLFEAIKPGCTQLQLGSDGRI